MISVRSKCLTATRYTYHFFAFPHLPHYCTLNGHNYSTRDEEDVFLEKASAEVIASITSKRIFEADGFLPNPLNLQLGMRPCNLQIQ
mmetsp:Transcript_24715/g.36618  ORF Transcript_24715/g.36618 Transcript_24715/m.36618 type:complete len:87 (-) Transcript_24715:657-917(-)